MRRRGEKEKAAARKRKPPRERKVAREAGAPAAPPANAATRAGAGGGLGVENIEVGRMLGAVADLLEIQEANPFRVRAYRNAVRTIEGLTRPLVKMVAAGEDLTELPGIGGEMAHHITEIVTTGRLSVLDEILKKVPASLIELTLLDGLGPKRTRKLWEALGITTIDALERALDAGRVEELEGFGEKTAARIRQSIADHRRHVGRFRLVDADQFVRPLLEYMREVRGIEEMEVAGSYRRRRETVGDIDLLIVCENADPVMRHFVAYPKIVRVDSAGETRGTVILPSGLQVDLRIIPRRSYGAALHYFTGSKEHNIAVRKLGVQGGLRISEYGIFRVPAGEREEELGPEEGERVGGAREEDVFRAVGMVWVPAELRENRGEVEAALEGRLPRLLTPKDIRGDLQVHSIWSDGKNTIEEMARAAAHLGYEYLAITDHSPAVTVAGGLKPAELEAQWEEIEQVRERVPEIALFRSMEVDIRKDGSLDLPDRHLERLDLVLVSVHSHMELGKTQMTDRMIKAISHPEADVLAHPTGRLINRREPYEVEMEAVLEAAAALDVAVELNANPERLDLNDVHVFRARELGAKIVISTDSHSVDNLRFMAYGVDQARRGWLERKDVINTLPRERFRRWLDRRRR